MSKKESIDELPIIEVPPELRGLSDEEIIRNTVYTNKRNIKHRLSKRERDAAKLQREKEKMQKIAMKFEEPAEPAPKPSIFVEPIKKVVNAFSPSRSRLESLFVKKDVAEKKATINIPPKAEPPKPVSGRVLKCSFGGRK
ncbi:MAG: hypothetical protein HUK21_11535 [Fibrobacteraceae bacterium]|nr:hypothetical protein [Fibrobacteraceae bacterium]